MKVGPNVAWRLVSENLLTVTSILGLRALPWRLLTKASLGASLSLGYLLRVKEERESGLFGQPWGPDEKHRAHWRTRHKPPGVYPQTRLHLCPSQLRNSVGTRDWGGGDRWPPCPPLRHQGVPAAPHSALAGRGQSALPAVPLTRLTRAAGCPPCALEARCSLHLALVPRAVAPGGAAAGPFRNFPGKRGEALSPRLQPPPGDRTGPSRGREPWQEAAAFTAPTLWPEAPRTSG